MEKQQPSRPVKTKQTFKPLPNEVEDVIDAAVPTDLEPDQNKYARRVKVGSTKTIGRSPNYVESVGLGSLRVLTSSGFRSEYEGSQE